MVAFILLVLLLVLACDGAAVHWPCIRIAPCKQTSTELDAYMEETSVRRYNHDAAGISARQPPIVLTADSVPRGLRVNRRRIFLGRGRSVYDDVRQSVLSGSLIDKIGWGHFIASKPDGRGFPRVGSIILTHMKVYGIAWVASPCRVTHVHVNQKMADKSGIYSSIGFSTVKGHLLAGEERFGVEWRQDLDDSVWLDLWSVSRGSEVLGRIAFPFVIPIQRAFFSALGRAAALGQ